MKDEYLQLIVNVLKETQPITELTESKKGQFQEKILDKSLEYQQRKLITKKDFLTNCEEAVNQLKILVKDEVKNEKYKNISKLYSILGINKTASPKNEDYYNAYVVNIKSLVKTAKIGMCFNDIKFIEDVFGSIDSIKPQQLELLDIPKTSAIEKIIYLNELGVIEYLRGDPQFGKNPTLLAEFLHLVTGERANTLQPILSRFVQNTIDNKNHPYYREKTVKDARQTLINAKIQIKEEISKTKTST